MTLGSYRENGKMIQRKVKLCKCGCGREGYIWAHGMLKECYYKSKPQKQLVRTSLNKSFKPSGEGALMETLISTRPHTSFITGQEIININHNNCAHVLNKKKYPEFRLYDKNIIFLDNRYPCLEHHLYDNGTEEQRIKYAEEMKKGGIIVNWQKLYDLKQELMEEYARRENQNSRYS